MGLNNRIRIKLTRISVIFLLIGWGLLKPEFARFADLVYSYRGFMLLNLLVCGTTAYLAILALALRRYFWLIFADSHVFGFIHSRFQSIGLLSRKADEANTGRNCRSPEEKSG